MIRPLLVPADDPIREQARAVEEASVSMPNHGKRLRASAPEGYQALHLEYRPEHWK